MTEFVQAADGIRLAFERLGPPGIGNGIGIRTPVVLVHGFGSSRQQNWKSTGWFDDLTAAGRQVVAMDCRGHGQSDKPHEEAAYGHDRMAQDVLSVMDAAGVNNADVVGYSMGGFIALRLATQAPARVASLSLGGVGAHYLDGTHISAAGSRERLAAALLVEDKASITDPRGRMFRTFAEQPGKDRIALAACMRAMSPPLPAEILSQLQQRVLVVCGAQDDIAGTPEPLAQAFSQGHSVSIPGRDHMTAVGERKTRRAVIDFLEL